MIPVNKQLNAFVVKYSVLNVIVMITILVNAIKRKNGKNKSDKLISIGFVPILKYVLLAE